MKVLVTGGTGYIGSKLVAKLPEKGYQVRSLDSLAFDRRHLSSFQDNQQFEFICGDFRNGDIVSQALNGVDGVVHLAAIVTVTGKESAAEQQLIRETNYEAACRFADRCKEEKVKRFIFTSTCSNYGLSDTSKLATEDDPLNPTSPYAVAKVEAERYILDSAGNDFHPTVLRLATVFGPSLKMSYGPMLNSFVREAVVDRSLLVFGPESWRPFVHIEDVVEAILLVLAAPLELVSAEVFNVGANSLNHRKIELVKLIAKHLPETKVEIKEGKVDPRSYRVSFDKIASKLGFKATRSAEEGIVEIIKMLEQE